MAILPGTYVTIQPFVNDGCINTRGRVMKCCQELCCVEGSTQQEVVCAKYWVSYKTKNCNECAVHETPFCEWELIPDPPPPPV